jgi:hypothetical protein
MQRGEHRARCALIRTLGSWEVRVLVDNGILMSESCDSTEDAFILGSDWQRRMRHEGWRQIVPRRSTLDVAS